MSCITWYSYPIDIPILVILNKWKIWVGQCNIRLILLTIVCVSTHNFFKRKSPTPIGEERGPPHCLWPPDMELTLTGPAPPPQPMLHTFHTVSQYCRTHQRWRRRRGGRGRVTLGLGSWWNWPPFPRCRDGVGRGGEVRKWWSKTDRERTGLPAPPDTLLGGPLPAGLHRLASSDGGTGSTPPSAPVVMRWTAPVPQGQLLLCRRSPLPSAILGKCLWQPSLSFWAKANRRLSSQSVSERKCWLCCSEVWPAHCNIAHFKSGYSNRLTTGSCWAMSWASPERSGSKQAAHWDSGHPHVYVACLNNSRYTSWLSHGPIFAMAMWAMTMVGAAEEPACWTRFLRTCRSYSWALSWEWMLCSCSLHRLRGAWCWVW